MGKRSVFVGGWPLNITEGELRQHFAEVGEIDAVRIVRDKYTSECKGIAFVLFKKRWCVVEALKYWGSWLKNRRIRVTKIEKQGAEKAEDVKGAHPAEMRQSSKRLHSLRKIRKAKKANEPKKK